VQVVVVVDQRRQLRLPERRVPGDPGRRLGRELDAVLQRQRDDDG
jgi:hypothetical protein